MHVNVHLCRIQFDKEDGQGIAPNWQQGVVCLHNRVGQASIFDVAPVDEQVDLSAGGAGER